MEGVTFPKAGSEDAVLSVVVCRINERQLFISLYDYVYCERKVVDTHDWKVYGTCDYNDLCQSSICLCFPFGNKANLGICLKPV